MRLESCLYDCGVHGDDGAFELEPMDGAEQGCDARVEVGAAAQAGEQFSHVFTKKKKKKNAH